ncbi:MAG: hypothetical protein VB877_07140 [Pirellulaceae bacterium]
MLKTCLPLAMLAPLLLLTTGCSNTLEQQVPGTYEYHDELFDLEKVFRTNGRVDTYDENGLLEDVLETWQVVDGEVRVVFPDGDSMIWQREENGDIRLVGWIKDGERDDELPESEERLWTRKVSFLPYVLALAGLLAGLGIVFIWKRSRAAG